MEMIRLRSTPKGLKEALKYLDLSEKELEIRVYKSKGLLTDLLIVFDTKSSLNAASVEILKKQLGNYGIVSHSCWVKKNNNTE